MSFSFDPSQRLWWWREQNERVSRLAAILRAQGGLPPPRSGTFIPPELRAGYGASAAETGDADSGADFASFEAALPDDTQRFSQPLAQLPRNEMTAPIVISPSAPPMPAPPAPPTPPAPPSPPQLGYQPAALAVAAAPTLTLSGSAALGLSATAAALSAGALGLTAAGAAYWLSRTPEQQQAIIAHVKNIAARAGQAATDGFIPPIGAPTIANSQAAPPSISAFVDPAPNLPPLPGFTPPNFTQPQEFFPENSGYKTETEGFLPFRDVKQYGIEAFPDESGIMNHFMILENRKGNPDTRRRNEDVRDWFIRQYPGWQHIGGGRDQETGEEIKEVWIPGPGKLLGDGRPGGAYADLTFRSPDGKSLVHINTVDSDRFESPTLREVENAEKMKRLTTDESGRGDTILLVPKYTPRK